MMRGDAYEGDFTLLLSFPINYSIQEDYIIKLILGG